MNEMKKIEIEIENAIYKIIPKNITEKYINENINNNFYKYDNNAINKALFLPIRDLLERGGKRWRPKLFLLFLDCFGLQKKAIETYFDISAIIEIIHNGTLLTDDIEDDANLRRGKPCIHKMYGNDIAINAGSAMYFLPLKLIEKTHISDKQKNRLYKAYVDEMNNLSFGQAIDIFWHKNNIIPNIKEYLQMCLCKTGALSSMAVRFASILAKKQKEEEMLFSKAIGHLGVGFQIQDDILDIVLKNRDNFGKVYGNDITEGKKTLMIIHTYEVANNNDKNKLISILDKHTKNKDEIDDAIKLLNKYDAINFAKNQARKIAKNAWNEIDIVLKKSKAKQELKNFFDYLIEREI